MIAGSNPARQTISCASGGMEDTLLSEGSAERCEGSSPSWRTKNREIEDMKKIKCHSIIKITACIVRGRRRALEA